MTVINVLERPKLKNPVLIEGLPGVGNIGRVAVGYMVSELKAKKFAEIRSKWFFPFVMLRENYKIHLLKQELYYVRAKKPGQRDLILLIGDCQSLSSEGHYEVSEKVLDFVKSLGTKEVFTVGGLATGEIKHESKVIGAVTDESVLRKYEKYGIDFRAGEKVGYIVGAAGLLLGIGREKGMKGMCLLGQTSGFPIVTDPKAAEMVLNVLAGVLNLDMDMKKLDTKVKEMEEFMKKVEDLQRKALFELAKTAKPIKKDEVRYIG